MGTMLTIFIFLIVAVTLITPISQQTNQISAIHNETNESITVVANDWVTLANDDLTSVFEIRNATDQVAILSGNWTGDNVDLAGGRVNVTQHNGSYHIDYEFYPDTYVHNSTSRALVPLIIIFFALAIIAGAIFWIRKDGGFGGLFN